MEKRFFASDNLPFVFNLEDNIQLIGNKMDTLLQKVEKQKLPDKTSKIIKECLQNTDLDEDSFFFPMADEIAKLIDENVPYENGKFTYSGNANSYHNGNHTQEVIINVAFLLAITEEKQKDFGFILTKEDKALVLFSALIHDLGHNGKNLMNEPFAQEERSFELALPIIKKYANQKIISDLQAILLVTDITYNPNVFQNILDFHRKGYAKDKEPSIPTEATNAFAILLKDRKTAELASILCDADIACSVFYNFACSWRHTLKLAEERRKENKDKEKRTELEILQNFDIFCKRFANIKSMAGQLLVPNFIKIKEQVQKLILQTQKNKRSAL